MAGIASETRGDGNRLMNLWTGASYIDARNVISLSVACTRIARPLTASDWMVDGLPGVTLHNVRSCRNAAARLAGIVARNGSMTAYAADNR